jgi:hypothetical protein
MNGSAHITSIDALRRWRAALLRFGQDANDALAALQLELQRAVDWFEHDRPAYWQQKVRRGWEKIAEARADLERCEMMAMEGSRPACRDEQEALEKAKRELRRAEETLEAVKRWVQAVRHEVTEFQPRIGQLASWLDADLPRGTAALARMIDALAAYASTSPATLPEAGLPMATMARPADAEDEAPAQTSDAPAATEESKPTQATPQGGHG